MASIVIHWYLVHDLFHYFLMIQVGIPMLCLSLYTCFFFFYLFSCIRLSYLALANSAVMINDLTENEKALID